MRTFEKMRESRLTRMREGKNAGEIVELPSDPEVRLVIVPLTDGEWLKALGYADKADAGDNEAGLLLRSEVQKKSILYYACREMSDWEKPFFESLSEVEELAYGDAQHIYDAYLEMVADYSPSFFMLGEEEIDALKKVLQRIEWNALSGRQQYAAMRFLNSIREDLLADSFSGSPSTSSLTTRNDMKIPVENAEPPTTDPS